VIGKAKSHHRDTEGKPLKRRNGRSGGKILPLINADNTDGEKSKTIYHRDTKEHRGGRIAVIARDRDTGKAKAGLPQIYADERWSNKGLFTTGHGGSGGKQRFTADFRG
jgi:hypothetical protein